MHRQSLPGIVSLGPNAERQAIHPQPETITAWIKTSDGVFTEYVFDRLDFDAAVHASSTVEGTPTGRVRAGLADDTNASARQLNPLAGGPPRWTLTITCPRPHNRSIDDYHTRPEKVAKIAAEWFSPDAELTLTERTVRLVYTQPRSIENIAEWNERLARALDALYLDTRTEDGGHRLPRPVRTEVREDDT